MKIQILIGLLLLSSITTMNAQTTNTSPLPVGETVIGGHLHAGASNEVWTDASNLYFNYKGNATSTYFWNLGGANGKSIMTLMNSGNIGIGVDLPSAKLDINGNLRLRDSSAPTWDIGFGSNGDPVRFLSIDVVNSFLPEDPLELVYSRGSGVKIGRDNSDNKYLKVFGLIEAKEIKVLSNINSDFVFENNYELMSLSEVESFIIKNKHLPDVPSAKEFKEKGQNLAEVDNMLLRKIEELTLYTIEQNKRLEQQNQEIIKLKTQNAKIKALEEKIKIIESASK